MVNWVKYSRMSHLIAKLKHFFSAVVSLTDFHWGFALICITPVMHCVGMTMENVLHSTRNLAFSHCIYILVTRWNLLTFQANPTEQRNGILSHEIKTEHEQTNNSNENRIFLFFLSGSFFFSGSLNATLSRFALQNCKWNDNNEIYPCDFVDSKFKFSTWLCMTP